MRARRGGDQLRKVAGHTDAAGGGRAGRRHQRVLAGHHREFTVKHMLSFPLLSDADNRVTWHQLRHRWRGSDSAAEPVRPYFRQPTSRLGEP